MEKGKRTGARAAEEGFQGGVALGALEYDNNIGCYGNIRRGWGEGGC